MSITPIYGGRAQVVFDDQSHSYTINVPGVVSGLWQPSVTGIIGIKDKSAPLVKWSLNQMVECATRMLQGRETWTQQEVAAILQGAKEAYKFSRQSAANVGSVVHAVLEKEVNYRGGFGTKPFLPLFPEHELALLLTPEQIVQANNAISAGFEFLDAHKIKVIQTEAPRWSPTYGYIGTGDLIALVDGVLSLLDWKTGKRLYPTVRLQLAGYKAAYEEEFPEQKIIQTVGINITREGKLEAEFYPCAKYHEQDFRTFLALLDVWRWDCENRGNWSRPAPRVLGPLDAAIAAGTIQNVQPKTSLILGGHSNGIHSN